MSFTITGLDPEQFEALFSLDDAALAARNIVRTTVDAPRGYPCRISLTDAPVGETVLLLNYEHQPAASPYRASHAIFVARSPREAAVYADEVPQALRDRLLSLRAFDERGTMLDAAVVDGKEVEPVIERLLATPGVAYIHAHNAARGCYAARIERARS